MTNPNDREVDIDTQGYPEIDAEIDDFLDDGEEYDMYL